MLTLIPTFQRIDKGDIVRFSYKGVLRRVLVMNVYQEKGYFQGENLVYDGEVPENQFGSYRFERVLPTKERTPAIHIEQR